jgi:hypothetical protein
LRQQGAAESHFSLDRKVSQRTLHPTLNFRLMCKVSGIRAGTVITLTLVWSSASVCAQSTAVSSIAPPSSIYELEPLGKPPQIEETQPLVDWLPIWGRQAREKGFDLPLPFGVGVSYTYIDQHMVVSDVKIQDKPLGVTIRDAATTSHTGVLRFDTWVFPFLNVYGLAGETAGVTKPAVVFPNG